MPSTMCRHLLTLVSFTVLTCSVAHAKALEENEDEVLVLAERDLDYQEKEEVFEEAEKREEAEMEEEEFLKREDEVGEEFENEATKFEDLDARTPRRAPTVHAPFTLVDRRGRRIEYRQKEGLLLFNGGTVCSDHFSDNSAHAICRTMGFDRMSRWRTYRPAVRYGTLQSSKRILLDDVVCTSNHWSSCTSRPNHNCVHNQDVFLKCVGSGFVLINSDGDRITTQAEGLLTYHEGTVCDDLFSMNSAHAVCRVMGFASALSYDIGVKYGEDQTDLAIEVDKVKCSGSYWNFCSIGMDYPRCGHHQDVFLTCVPGHAHNHGFRLVNWRGVNLQDSCEGLLLYDGGTVCRTGFNMVAANAVCHALDFQAAVNFTSGHAYGAFQTKKNITMDAVNCRDTTWTHCRFNAANNCGHSEDILLKCRPS